MVIILIIVIVIIIIIVIIVIIVSIIIHPLSVRRFPSFRTQPLENLSHYL